MNRKVSAEAGAGASGEDDVAVPVLEGLKSEIAIVFDEVCSDRRLLAGLPLRPFGLVLVPVVPPFDRNWDGGNRGHTVVPASAITVDAAIHNGNFASFLQLANPRLEIGPAGEEIHFVAVLLAAQTTDEAGVFARELHRDLPYPFRGFTDCRVHPMLDVNLTSKLS